MFCVLLTNEHCWCVRTPNTAEMWPHKRGGLWWGVDLYRKWRFAASVGGLCWGRLLHIIQITKSYLTFISPDGATTFRGESYISWSLTIPMERRLSLSLDVRTEQSHARLMHAQGRVDYSYLEVKGAFWCMDGGPMEIFNITLYCIASHF